MTRLEMSFENLEQQQETNRFGMWVFLATEMLFFGAVITAYAIYRSAYPAAFSIGSTHLNLTLGTINTAVLLCSSLTAALAVRALQFGNARGAVWLMLATIVLGAAFLGIKGCEYSAEYREGFLPGESFTFTTPSDKFGAKQVELFFVFYFVMTAIHALHMLIGLTLFGMLALRTWRHGAECRGSVALECGGLYWHFVDVVWIFLYPLLYLAGSAA